MAIPEVGVTCLLYKDLDWRTVTNWPVNNIAENPAVANKLPKKNAPTSAKVKGVKSIGGVQNQVPNNTQKRTIKAMRFYWCAASHSVERFEGGVLA